MVSLLEALLFAGIAAVALAVVFFVVAHGRAARRRRRLRAVLQRRDAAGTSTPSGKVSRAADADAPTRGGVRRVVVVGGSFAGLTVARQLDYLGGEALHITVIEKRDYFEYTPGALRLIVEPAHGQAIQAPLREVLRDTGVHFVRGEVTSITPFADDGDGSGGGDDDSGGGERRTPRGAGWNAAGSPGRDMDADAADPAFATAAGAVMVAMQAPPAELDSLASFASRTSERNVNARIPYDVLVLATGSSYAWPIKPSAESYALEGRRETTQLAHAQAVAADDILVVGAGPVGVELAGELAHKFPGKHITIVSNKDRLLPALPHAMGQAALEWFRARRVDVVLNDAVPIKHHGLDRRDSADSADLESIFTEDRPPRSEDGGDGGGDDTGEEAAVRRRRTSFAAAEARERAGSDGSGSRRRASSASSGMEAEAVVEPSDTVDRLPTLQVLTDNGLLIRAQVVYTCVGQVASVGYLESSPAFRRHLSAHGGLLTVDDDLRVPGMRSVFAIGDLVWHASNEQKLAHTAELTGLAAAENIVRLLEAGADTADGEGYDREGDGDGGGGDGGGGADTAAPLEAYPHIVAHYPKTPRIVVITLGKREAVLRFNNIVLTGVVGRRVAAFAKDFIEWSKMLQVTGRATGVWFWEVGDALALWLNRTFVKPPEGAEPVK